MKKTLLFLTFFNLILFNAFSQEGYISDGRNGCKSFTKQVTDRKMSWNGKCLNGYANGYGTLKVFQKDALYYTFIGSLKNGKLEGQGTFTGAKGDKYVGQWKNHNKEGQGTMTYASGHKYVGQWKNNNREGQGTMTYPDGSKKAGYWIKGNFNGISEVPLPCVISKDRQDEQTIYDESWNGTSIHHYKIYLYSIRSQLDPYLNYNFLITISEFKPSGNKEEEKRGLYIKYDSLDKLNDLFSSISNKKTYPYSSVEDRMKYGSDPDSAIRQYFKDNFSEECPCEGFIYK